MGLYSEHKYNHEEQRIQNQNITNNANNFPVMETNNALGYNQGRVSELDQCVKEFIEFIKYHNINADEIGKPFSISDDSKYNFMILPNNSNDLGYAYNIIAIEKQAKTTKVSTRLMYQGEIKNRKLDGTGKLIIKSENGEPDEYYEGLFKIINMMIMVSINIVNIFVDKKREIDMKITLKIVLKMETEYITTVMAF